MLGELSYDFFKAMQAIALASGQQTMKVSIRVAPQQFQNIGF